MASQWPSPAKHFSYLFLPASPWPPGNPLFAYASTKSFLEFALIFAVHHGLREHLPVGGPDLLRGGLRLRVHHAGGHLLLLTHQRLRLRLPHTPHGSHRGQNLHIRHGHIPQKGNNQPHRKIRR